MPPTPTDPDTLRRLESLRRAVVYGQMHGKTNVIADLDLLAVLLDAHARAGELEGEVARLRDIIDATQEAVSRLKRLPDALHSYDVARHYAEEIVCLLQEALSSHADNAALRRLVQGAREEGEQ